MSIPPAAPLPPPPKHHLLQMDGRLWYTIFDLSKGKLSGELIVCYGEHSARVHPVQGDIAWVHEESRLRRY